MRDKKFRDFVLLVEQTHHQRLLNPVKSAIAHRDSRGNAHRLAGEASLTEKLVVAQNADNRFLSLLGCHRMLHPASPNVEDGIRRVSWAVDSAVRAVLQTRQSASNPGDKSIGPFGCPMRNLDPANSSWFRKFQDEQTQGS